MICEFCCCCCCCFDFNLIESCDVDGITKDVINININHFSNGEANEPIVLAAIRDDVELAPVESSSLSFINKMPDKKVTVLKVDVINGNESLPTIKVTDKQMAVLGLNNEEDAKDRFCNKCNVNIERYIFGKLLTNIRTC